MMKIALALSFALLLATAAPLAAQDPPPKGAVGEVISATFTVEAVDQAARLVTLKAADGSIRTIEAGPEVKNLAQVRAGDVVKATYLQAVAVELKKGGSGIRSASARESASGARLGEKPAGVAKRQVRVVATVEKVDASTQLVTIKGPKGNLVDVAVADAAKFKQVSVGDQVEVIYTEALAIDVSTPGTK